ncbi:TIMELESS-interacting protein isoform X1 [Chelmon rostratus]|uniref:TIMELESS-interacting protein isoform X1 n=1 Tax=Chelmon rostratus TaxID=109905 RepID=UPI001BE80A8F|nr:TIMELESS-interacting protein isoform X1 [Chelmon rostratus]XP_041795940.1 TIMELESS-interacting protein isoform X1 [Chelmon rostratus]XP_041795949.1 TIMELESS-interacting protein isoform X1 [Chelmon rostratus]
MLDPMENGLYNIPDYDGMEDEAFPPLPPPHSPGQGGPDEDDPFANGEEDGDVSKLADVPVAKRKGMKRPQPKLDSHRLISERGLPALRTLFDNVHFKGKGHEAEDLQLLMQKMENWAHRLYPKLQFEDFIDRVEALGKKKEVQTCLKRIRLDMPLTHDDYRGQDGEEEAAPTSHVFGDSDPFISFPNDPQELVQSTPAPAAPPAASPPAPSLTEEQRERMELNRRRALERKLARQQQQTADPSHSQTVDSSADEPTSASSANVLDRSEDQEEEEELDLEPASSSTQQPGQHPHKDSEPSAASPQREPEEESSVSRVQQPSSSCEDGH